jgi:putative phosphoesterase
VKAIDQFLTTVIAECDGNSRWIYASGFSRGRLGVLEIARRLNRFAKIVPIDSQRIPEHLPNILIWIHYGGSATLPNIKIAHQPLIEPLNRGIWMNAAPDTRIPAGQPLLTTWNQDHRATCRSPYSDTRIYEWLRFYMVKMVKEVVMKIAIISDIHDNVWNLRATMHWLMSLQGDDAIEQLICCGDLCSPFVMGLITEYCKEQSIPIHLVFGNNDGDASRITAQAKDKSFLYIHNEFAELAIKDNELLSRASFKDKQGMDNYFETTVARDRIAVHHFDSAARPIAEAGKYGLVCFGHNHSYEATYFGDSLAVNPGALMGYNPLATEDVRHVEPTFAIYDTAAPRRQEVRFFEVKAPWREPEKPGEIAPFTIPNPIPTTSTPHLTPAKLVGRKFSNNTFNGVTVALVGYCPRPRSLDKYHPLIAVEQHFIHIPPGSVQICSHNDMTFLSISHVYGGPVSSALIEELSYYEIKYVLAYGLAGGLGTKNLKMGDFYIVAKALASDGTTRHYTSDKLIASDEFLNSRISELAEKTGFPKMTPVQALTDDAIYREYDEDLNYAKKSGCDIVNCDSSHLFAVSRAVGIKSTECGVISDVAKGTGEEWESKLSAMLSADNDAEQDPLDLAGKIGVFYVETLMPELMRS